MEKCEDLRGRPQRDGGFGHRTHAGKERLYGHHHQAPPGTGSAQAAGSRRFFSKERPEYVFLAVEKVGGIMANQEALADFMYENATLEMNVIQAAWKNG